MQEISQFGTFNMPVNYAKAQNYSREILVSKSTPHHKGLQLDAQLAHLLTSHHFLFIELVCVPKTS